MNFWQSILELRKWEVIITWTVMIAPLLGSAMLLTIRHRIKTLQHQTSQSQGFYYEETLHRLKNQNQELNQALQNARFELTGLKRITAPWQISEEQAHILLEKLRGVKASPVIVSAYAFEEESAGYALQLASILRHAGWEVSINKSSMNDFKGLSLGSVNLTQHPLSGLQELRDAFKSAHLDLHQREISTETIAGSLQDESLVVVVGRK